MIIITLDDIITIVLIVLAIIGIALHRLIERR